MLKIRKAIDWKKDKYSRSTKQKIDGLNLIGFMEENFPGLIRLKRKTALTVLYLNKKIHTMFIKDTFLSYTRNIFSFLKILANCSILN